jgi:RNA polymerase sigma-70 factor, ECF subfamily
VVADGSFDELMAKVRAGDEVAESLVFRRFARRLIGLASKHLDAWVRERVDVEDAVLSACKSFFLRFRQDAFDVADWEELWALLALITLRKCQKRREHTRAARRDPARELSLEALELESLIPDRGPTPEEAAIFAETLERLFNATGPGDLPIVEKILMGYSGEEIAERCDCSVRTVGRVRQRTKERLLRQLAH